MYIGWDRYALIYFRWSKKSQIFSDRCNYCTYMTVSVEVIFTAEDFTIFID